MHRTENAELSCEYHLIASDIVKLFSSCVRKVVPWPLNVPAVTLLMSHWYELSTSAAVMLFSPTRQSFESDCHMMVCRPIAFAI
jgi:hypothetical protein